VITVQKVLFLRNVALFSGMPPSELSHLAGIAEEYVYGSGESIIIEGEHGDSLFLIVEGTVRVHRGDADLAELGPEDYFGEMSILDGEPRSASVTAHTDCLLLCIDQAGFQAILSRHFEVALTIIRTLTHRLRVADTANAVKTDDVSKTGETAR
jgi:CRP-like cAMP-binding protein